MCAESVRAVFYGIGIFLTKKFLLPSAKSETLPNAMLVCVDEKFSVRPQI